MATYAKRGSKYLVRWKTLLVTRNADGTESREWKDRGRTVPTERDAKRLVAEVESVERGGQGRWEDQRETAVCTLGTIADGYADAVASGRSTTRTFRRGLMDAWLSFAGADKPANGLSIELLEQYAATLDFSGRRASRSYRKVLEVERMWKWARKRASAFPGVPEPQETTGDGGRVQAPVPVARSAAPTLVDVDAMLSHVRIGYRYGDVHRRIGLVVRYTGLRISQLLGLRWADVHLDEKPHGPWLAVRAGVRGAKASRARAIPLHSALAAAMRSWPGPRDGLVFDPGPDAGVAWGNGEPTRDAFTSAWKAAKVDPAKWSVSKADRDAGERGAGSPVHCVRAAVKEALRANGVPRELVGFYIGHSEGSTSRAYSPEATPEAIANWKLLVAAVETIPPHTEPAVGG